MKKLLAIAIGALLSIMAVPHNGECDQFSGNTGSGFPPSSEYRSSMPDDMTLDRLPNTGDRNILPPSNGDSEGNSSSSGSSGNSTSVNKGSQTGDEGRLVGEAEKASITDFVPANIKQSEDPIKDASDRVAFINNYLKENHYSGYVEITETGTVTIDGKEYEYADVEGWAGESESSRTSRIHERYTKLKDGQDDALANYNSSGSSSSGEYDGQAIEGTSQEDLNLPESETSYNIPDPDEARPEILDDMKGWFDEKKWEQEIKDAIADLEADMEATLDGVSGAMSDSNSANDSLGEDINRSYDKHQRRLDEMFNAMSDAFSEANNLIVKANIYAIQVTLSLASAYYYQATAIEESVNRSGVESAKLEKDILETIENLRKEREKAKDAIDSIKKESLPRHENKQGEIQQEIADLLEDLLAARDSTNEDKQTNDQQNDDIRENHNEAVQKIADNSYVGKVDKSEQIDIDVAKDTSHIFTPYKSRIPPSHPYHDDVVNTRLYIDQARSNVENVSDEYKQQRRDLLDSADVTTDIAEQQFVDGDNEAGEAILDVAKTIVDLATDFLPYVSTAKDVYTGFTGKNFFTGEKVEGWERGIAIASAVIDIGTLGMGGKVVKIAGKGGGWLLGKIADGAKRLASGIERSAPECADIFHALWKSDKVAAGIRGIDDVPDIADAVGKNTGELVEELNNLGLKKGDRADVISEAKAVIEDPAWVKTNFDGRTVYKNDSIIKSGRPEVLDDTVPKSIRDRIMNRETNVDLMKSGKAPIGTDGRQINLHHLTGQEPGTMVEVAARDHPDTFETMHSLIEKSFRNDPVKEASYDKFKDIYWKKRALDFLGE